MKKQGFWCRIGLLFLAISLVSSSTGVLLNENSTTSASLDDYAPGEIINVTVSPPYPHLGTPIDLTITLKGNPGESRFNETITVTDTYEGIIAVPGGITWMKGESLVTHLSVTIGRASTYTKKVRWDPCFVGNHSLSFETGIFPARRKNISVHYETPTIIYPSLGCPAILRKNTSEQLIIGIAEDRAAQQHPLLIKEINVERVNGVDTYSIDQQNSCRVHWIAASETSVQDELVACYSINTIPVGFYNVSITTNATTYRWPHAVQIIDDDPSEFTFVQLTDPHIGKSYVPGNEKKELLKKIRVITEDLQPDFIVISGDLVDWYNSRFHAATYPDFVDVLVTCTVPVYTLPGNHDRYEHGLKLFYAPYMDLSSYHRYLNPLSDYVFDYGSVNFIMLNSGYDYSRWENCPESSGLTDLQMDLLEHQWGNTTLNHIIIMHHPAVNEINDKGLGKVPNSLPSGNDECIAFHRAEFISYCQENNVSLVLCGHTHENHVYTSEGTVPDDPFAWPLFVQTDTATLKKERSGGRVIVIHQGIVESYEYQSFS